MQIISTTTSETTYPSNNLYLKSLIHLVIYITYVHLARTKQKLTCFHHSIPVSHKWTMNVAPLFPHIIAKQHRNFLFQSPQSLFPHTVAKQHRNFRFQSPPPPLPQGLFPHTVENSTEISYSNPDSLPSGSVSSHHSKHTTEIPPHSRTGTKCWLTGTHQTH
jgi:hypothetical protein